MSMRTYTQRRRGESLVPLHPVTHFASLGGRLAGAIYLILALNPQ